MSNTATVKQSSERLIRQAEFEQPDASIAAIDYHSGRKLNKALINRLATCEYITEYRNIFITGATGSGKLIWPVLWYGSMQALLLSTVCTTSRSIIGLTDCQGQWDFRNCPEEIYQANSIDH